MGCGMPRHATVNVGLGNPGAKYAHNRHNIGFMAVDEIARGVMVLHRGAAVFSGETAEGTLDRERVLILLRPLTFMNDPGARCRKPRTSSSLSAGEHHRVSG